MYDERMLDLSTEADHTRHAFASTERFIRQAFIAADLGGGWLPHRPGLAVVSALTLLAGFWLRRRRTRAAA